MKTLVTTLVLTAACLVLPAVASAGIVKATDPGNFDQLILEDALVRGFSGNSPTPLLVEAGMIGLNHGGLSYVGYGQSIVIEFYGAVGDVAIRAVSTIAAEAALQAEVIDVAGGIRSTPVLPLSGFAEGSLDLSGAFATTDVRALRIRSIQGTVRLVEVEYQSRTLRPGQRIHAKLDPGEYRDVFVQGCVGRSLRLAALSPSTAGKIRARVLACDDLTAQGDVTDFAVTPSKSKLVAIPRSVLYRIRFYSVDAADSYVLRVDTADVFAKKYFKSKHSVAPKGSQFSTDVPFGALAGTKTRIVLAPDSSFSQPPGIALAELPEVLGFVDVSSFAAEQENGKLGFEAVPMHRGGAYRLTLAGFPGGKSKIGVVIEREAPAPGHGDLEL
jgi:hypothetical protein